MKHLIITGANRGIGLEILKGIDTTQYRIILAVRKVEKGQEAIRGFKGDITVLPLDLESPDSIRAFVSTYKDTFKTIDVFINNAGVFTNYSQLIPYLNHKVEKKWVVNTLSPYYLISLLSSCFTPNSKLIIMCSVAGHKVHMDLETMFNESGKMSYGITKYGNLLLVDYFTQILPNTHVIATHPGYTNTDIFDGYQNKNIKAIVKKASYLLGQSPSKGALSALEALNNDYSSGTYIVPKGFGQLYGKPKIDNIDRYVDKNEVETLVQTFNGIVNIRGEETI